MSGASSNSSASINCGNRPMMDVLKIAVSKERLRVMPADERALLILLGYAANQINEFSKLVLFSSNKDGSGEVEQKLSGAQTQMLVRVLVGVLNEALRLVQQRFLGTRIGRDYIPRLDTGGANALGKLKGVLGNSNILSSLRSNYIFHHPYDSDVNAAFEVAANDSDFDSEWAWYFSMSNYNSFYFLSEFVMMHGIMAAIGEPDLASAQHKLMGELRVVSDAMTEFTMSLTKAFWLQHFGENMDAEICAKLDDCPDILEVWIPFFVKIPNGPRG
jgi:hypothetical protein